MKHNMKYEEFNCVTFSDQSHFERMLGIDKPSGAIKKMSEMLSHPKLCLNDNEIKQFEVYRCPVCKNV